MDDFGNMDPRLMPSHLFSNCIRLDYLTAIRADITKQNYPVCPRHWYIDAILQCARCGDKFCFTVSEQKQWYECQGFWIESIAKQCKECRRLIRREKSLRREYDRDILITMSSDELAEKKRLVDVIDELSSLTEVLPAKLIEHRKILAHQIAKLSDPF